MEESINTEITSEQFEPEDGHEMANSTGRIVITKDEPKILSRYLSDRIASCHDSCKYGIQHSSEAKPWIVARKMAITRDKKIKVTKEIVISLAGMKKSTSSSNPSPDSNFGKPNSFVVIKDQSSMDGTVPSEKNLPPFEETDVSLDHALSDIKKEQSEQPSLPVQECSSSQTSREVVKTKGPFGSGSKNTSESRSKQRRTSLINDKKISMPPSSPLSSKHYVKKSSSITSKTAKNLKGVSNLKDQKNGVEVKAEPNSNDNLQEKILQVDQAIPDHKSVEPTLACDPANLSLVSPSSSGDTSLKQDNEQISNSGSPASSKKSFRHAGHGFQATKSLAHSPLSSGIKGKRRIQNKNNASSSSKRILGYADHGIRPTKSLSPSPLSSGVIIKRGMQNTVPNDSSSSAPLSKLRSSRRAFRHADHRIRPTKSLASSPLSSGIEQKRHMHHTRHSASSSSSSPSRSELPISPSNSSLGKQTGATFKSSKTGHHYPGENAKFVYRIKEKKSAIVGEGNKAIPSRRLSFRRGKVIEVQPQNNIARRLKFRPARQLTDAEREKVHTRKWISKRKGEDKAESNDEKIKSEKFVPRVQTVGGVKRRNFRKDVDGSKIYGPESGSQQVVLKHQNLLGKKVSRRLYNNVIEETASKLAELRKSKVKALVGAFETVISLDSPRPEASSL